MPAKSKKQRKLMGLALSNPGRVHKKNRGVLKMSKQDIRDFAGTKEEDLPEKKAHTVKGKAQAYGSKPFMPSEIDKGYRTVAKIPHPEDPDIEKGDVIADGKLKEPKPTGIPIGRPELDVPGFETSETIQRGVAV